jgi:hypothetical protein
MGGLRVTTSTCSRKFLKEVMDLDWINELIVVLLSLIVEVVYYLYRYTVE